MVVFKWLKNESFQAKSMVVSTNMHLKDLVNMDTFKKQGRNLDFVKQYNYLGVILDNEMNLTPLVNNIKKRVNTRIFQLRKVRKFMNVHAAILVLYWCTNKRFCPCLIMQVFY